MRLNWKPSSVFYGWWIVAACFLIALYTGGVITYGFTAFFEPIANEFGWSYTQVSLAASLRGLESGLLAPLLGILADRWGPRRLMFGGVIIIGLGLMFISRTISLGTFYGGFALLAIGVSTCGSTVLMTAVANWFRRKVSIAAGIVASGWGCGGLIVPLVVKLIDMYGWRTAMVVLGLGMLVIGLPLSLLVRRKPEQYGYLPDGEVSGTVMPDEGLLTEQTITVDTRAKQALMSRTFWHIAVALMFKLLAFNAAVTHVMPYLSSIGVRRSTSSLVASAIPVLSIGGRLGFGWLGDKFDKRRLLVGTFAMTALGLACFEYTSVGWTWLLVPFLILFGIGHAGHVPLRASLVREYFGRSNFGTILGFMIGITMLGSIAGPPLAGWVFDTWGSYHGIWLAIAGLNTMALIIVATAPPFGATTQTTSSAS